MPLSKFELAIQNQDICSKLSCWDAVYNEWENASVIAKMAKDPTAILDDVTRRKEMLEIELQCSNYYLDMPDGVQHPVPKPDYTENTPESFLLNSTPFVRQYDILSNKWGVLLCQKEYQTNDIRRSSREWL